MEIVGKSKRGFLVKVQCSICGNDFVAVKTDVVNGRTKTCGCWRTKRIADSLENGNNILIKWRSMNGRVSNNPEYKKKNIKICNEWLEFMPFYYWSIENGFKIELELDRIDNSGNYEPSNCRWVTRKQNLRNRDKQSINEKIAFNIKTDLLNGMPKHEASNKYGCSWAIIHEIYTNKSWVDVCELAEIAWLSEDKNRVLPIIEIKKRGERGAYKEKRKWTAEYRRELYRMAKNHNL